MMSFSRKAFWSRVFLPWGAYSHSSNYYCCIWLTCWKACLGGHKVLCGSMYSQIDSKQMKELCVCEDCIKNVCTVHFLNIMRYEIFPKKTWCANAKEEHEESSSSGNTNAGILKNKREEAYMTWQERSPSALLFGIFIFQLQPRNEQH